MIYDLQKGNIWKRISAFLLDIILLSILAVGAAFLISVITGYDKKTAAFNEIRDGIAEKHGINVTEEEYNAYTDEQKADYNARIAEADEEINSNKEAMRLYTLINNLTLIMVTGGALFSFLVLEFVVPLLFKNGQTLGKKVFGLAVMRTNGVKVNGPIMFIRSILGKYAVETMISAYIVIMFILGKADVILLILLALIPIVNIILLIATKTNSMLHDLLAGTVVVDFASQMIFASEEEMIEYKTRVHSEMAEAAGKENRFSDSASEDAKK